jgi:hypothetical protein
MGTPVRVRTEWFEKRIAALAVAVCYIELPTVSRQRFHCIPRQLCLSNSFHIT